MTREQKKEVQKLHDQGMGYKAISAATGISSKTVASFLKREVKNPEKTCLMCGCSIVQQEHRKEKKFCSDKCRMLWWNSHLDQVNRKAYHSYVCNHCGKPFLGYGKTPRKYCSATCWADHRRKNG